MKRSQGGLVITQVREESTAAEIGLMAGDVILRINNRRMNNLEDFREVLIASRTSSNVMLLVQRGRAAYYVPLPF